MPQRVFAGEARKINLVWRGNAQKTMEINAHLFQVSSSTAVPISRQNWKSLKILAGQTILESATLNFPAVKAETRFLVQWLDEKDKVIGTTDILVYPTDILKELKTLAGDEPVGVFDPENQLKPLLKDLAMEFTDLEDSGIASFHGALAIIGPFSSKAKIPEDLQQRVKTAAGNGAAIVCLRPPVERSDKLIPSFITVSAGKGRIVVAESSLVTHLADNPRAHLSIVQLSRQAVHPEAFELLPK